MLVAVDVAVDVAARCLFVACSLRTAVVVVARELGAMMTVESLNAGRVACGNRNVKAVRVRRAAMSWLTKRWSAGSTEGERRVNCGDLRRNRNRSRVYKHCSGLRALLPLWRSVIREV